MDSKLRLGVIFGGRSGEHEVSLMSSRSIFSVLNPEKYDVTAIGITHNGVWLAGEQVWEKLNSGRTDGLTRVTLLPYPGEKMLYAIRETPSGTQLEPYAELDVVFPVLHGTFGEDGTLQGLLELSDLAYVGAGVLGSAVGMDKALFKDVMRANGLPVVDWITVTRAEVEQSIDDVIRRAEALAGEGQNAYPLFTKPANLGSSVGITKCRTRSDLYEGLMEAATYDLRVLVERGVPNAREIECSVLGYHHLEASAPGEVIPSGDFYTYDAKYFDDRSQLVIPVPLGAEMENRIREIAVKACRAADISGMARADFLIDSVSGEVFISEINTIPGFTRISMYPKLWEASGIPYAVLVDRLIELALERKAERDRTKRQFRRNE